jgi:hypothetical protein
MMLTNELARRLDHLEVKAARRAAAADELLVCLRCRARSPVETSGMCEMCGEQHVLAVIAVCEEIGMGPTWAVTQHAERLGVSADEALADACAAVPALDDADEERMLRVAVALYDAGISADAFCPVACYSR